jgi:hypothetical protein
VFHGVTLFEQHEPHYNRKWIQELHGVTLVWATRASLKPEVNSGAPWCYSCLAIHI